MLLRDCCSELTFHVGTQEDQDQFDEKVRKQAMNELVQSWMDRLQLISVIVSLPSTVILLATECHS